MSDPQVTIVVVPRERFSYAKPSLESVYEHTIFPFSLVYVDGGSPPPIKRYLEDEARQKGFQLIRTNHYLSPNQARNIGLSRVKTKYVVFIDNDVMVTPGWLGALVRCAEETKAWVVGPLYLEGALEDQTIHMAGGTLQIKEQDGKRVLFEKHRFAGKCLTDVPVRLQRDLCEVIEFHTALVRTDVFERLGPLDEKLLNTREHVDLCLSVRKAGGTIYLEPESVTTHVMPPLAWSDIPFYMLRWSEAWSSSSIRHFNDKWNMMIDPRHHTAFISNRRRVLIRPLLKLTGCIFGRRADRIERTFIFPAERALNRCAVRCAWRERRPSDLEQSLNISSHRSSLKRDK